MLRVGVDAGLDLDGSQHPQQGVLALPDCRYAVIGGLLRRIQFDNVDLVTRHELAARAQTVTGISVLGAVSWVLS